MENITNRPEGQGHFHLLSDPVYGPNSKYFWPGSRWDASSYIASPIRIPSYVSGEEFLENYEDEFSGVEDYIESTDYLDTSYCDTLRDHFRKLYNDVESWYACALFVSAVYRDLFHQTWPYESTLLELRTQLDYESRLKPFLEEGRNEEAIIATGGSPVKEADKGERELSFLTCGGLMKLILASNTDLLFVSELVKVLQRTNIATRNQKQLKEGLLFMLTDTRALALLADERRQDSDREKLVLGLSLLQIEPKAAEKAVDESFSAGSYEPITRLVQDQPPKKDFAGNEASAYYLAPRYTARDYICDLVLSEETKTLLRDTEEYVEERLSVMGDFPDSKPFWDSPLASKGIRHNINTIRKAYNDLKIMANSFHNITCLGSLKTPSVRGKGPIGTADFLEYNDQWKAKGVAPQRSREVCRLTIFPKTGKQVNTLD
jgi:hypothetical protein